jgi:hypothetical protein
MIWVLKGFSIVVGLVITLACMIGLAVVFGINIWLALFFAVLLSLSNTILNALVNEFDEYRTD